MYLDILSLKGFFIFGDNYYNLSYFNIMKYSPNIKEAKLIEQRKISGTFLNPEYLFHYISEGNWTIRIENKLYELSSGNAILLPPDILHAVESLDKPSSLFVIHFELMDCKTMPVVISLPLKHKLEIEREISRIIKEREKNLPGTTLITQGILLKLLGMYQRYCCFTINHENYSFTYWKYIEKGMYYMEKYFTNSKLSLDDISTECTVSSPYFCKIFKEYIGVSPYRYLTRLRLKKAKEMMLHTRMNLSEIAIACGFNDIYSFSKVFKKIEGKSPKHWLDHI